MSAKKIENFMDLLAWQEAHSVVIEIYNLTKNFPKEEQFGLTIQMRRSAVSVTSNLAEGFGRKSFKDRVRFYYQSRGSLSELKNQVILAKDIKYISLENYGQINKKIDDSYRLLQGLISKTNSLSNSML